MKIWNGHKPFLHTPETDFLRKVSWLFLKNVFGTDPTQHNISIDFSIQNKYHVIVQREAKIFVSFGVGHKFQWLKHKDVKA